MPQTTPHRTRPPVQTFHGVPITLAAKAVGFSYVAVWRHAHGLAPISPKAALLYEEKLGIPRQVTRPDLWPPHTPKKGDQDDARNDNGGGTSPADLERIPF